MRDFRININDSRLFPVQAFFNAIPDKDFLRCLQDLSNGIGANFNEVNCSFSSDRDPGEPSFDGVSFSVLKDEVVISFYEFKKYARLAANVYSNDHPEHKSGVQILLEQIDKLQ